MKVGLFIPLFNEEDNIQKLFNCIDNFKKSNPEINLVIICVNDGSNDKTHDLAINQKFDYYYKTNKNFGLGSATRIGLEVAHYVDCDCLIKFDADLQHNIDDIKEVIDIFKNDQADIVYASRFKGKIHYKMPLYRYFGNKFFTMLMNLLTNYKITDSQTGMMCFNKVFLDTFEMPGLYNPPQQALLDGHLKGLRYMETKADFFKREKGNSFIGIRYISKVFSSLMKIYFKNNLYKSYFIISLVSLAGLILIIINALLNIIKSNTIYLENSTLFISLVILFLFSLTQGLSLGIKTNNKVYFRNKKNYLYINTEYILCKEK